MIVTLVKRKSRYLLACRLKSKNVEETKGAIIYALKSFRAKTLTLDNGREFVGHEDISRLLNITVYFAHPYSPQERA